MSDKPISKEREILYLRDPNFCPYCESRKVLKAEMVFNRGQFHQRLWCRECSEEWWEHYGRVSITKELD